MRRPTHREPIESQDERQAEEHHRQHYDEHQRIDSSRMYTLYTERELEIAYCTGLLNRVLTMDELSEELKTAQHKIDRLKEAFKRGDFNPLPS